MKTKAVDYVESLLVKIEDEVEVLTERGTNIEYLIDPLIESVLIMNETLGKWLKFNSFRDIWHISSYVITINLQWYLLQFNTK